MKAWTFGRTDAQNYLGTGQCLDSMFRTIPRDYTGVGAMTAGRSNESNLRGICAQSDVGGMGSAS